MPGHSSTSCPQMGKGFKGTCNSCGIVGHTWDQCPKFPYGKGKGTKGGMNAMDNGEEQMNLGGGEEKSEPEGERSSDENVESSRYAGMNKFSALAESWDNTDYQYDYGQTDWGWPGFYSLKKIEDEKDGKCKEGCECEFKKVETKEEKKAKAR